MRNIIIIVIIFSKFLLCYDISGKILNKETGESIMGANIIIQNQKQGTAANERGFFIIQNLKPGQYELNISHIAYRDKVKRIKISDQDIYLGNIKLTPLSIEAEAIEVVGERNTLIDEALDISAFETNAEALSNAPQLNKDVFELMKFSPSVSNSDPFTPLYHVRGSNPGANLVQLDGITIYNPQHFMASKSIFNPYAIKNIELLVGGFGAEYGGRNASILNIVSRRGNKNKVKGEFKPTTSGISGAIEFPVNDISTAMISCRFKTNPYSYMLFNSPTIMSDVIGKYNIKLGSTQLSLTAFHGRDYEKADFSSYSMFFTSFDNFEMEFASGTENYALGLKSKSRLLPDLLFNTNVYYSGSDINSESSIEFKVSDPDIPTDYELNYSTFIKNSISDFTVKTNLTYYTFFNQTLKLGVEFNDINFENQYTEISQKQNSRMRIQGAYFQDNINIGNFNIRAGLRSAKLYQNKKWKWEPRFSASYRYNGTTVNLNWGLYKQYLTTLNKQSDSYITSLKYQSLENHEPISSEKISIGLESYLTEDISLSCTPFYKDLFRLYDISYNIYGKKTIEKGEGESYGIETMIKGKYKKLSGWISYTYSRSFRRFLSYKNGKKYPYDGDKPHNFKALLLYKLTKNIKTSVSFRLSSGNPKTWAKGRYSQYNYSPITDKIGSHPRDLTPKKNNVRYPTRSSLEIGWKKDLQSGFGHNIAEYLGAEKSYYTVSIKNVLFLDEDPINYYYDDSRDQYVGFDPYFFPCPIVSTGYVIKF